MVGRMKRTSVVSLTTLSQMVISAAFALPFRAHASTGQTPTGARLRQILDIYVPRVENTSVPHKPISLLVITDGVPSECLTNSVLLNNNRP